MQIPKLTCSSIQSLLSAACLQRILFFLLKFGHHINNLINNLYFSELFLITDLTAVTREDIADYQLHKQLVCS